MNEREFIKWLADQFQEKRSDVSKMCEEFLITGEVPVIASPEPRYSKCQVPNTDIEIEYDTLTTLFEYHTSSNQWEECEKHEYFND